MLDLLLRLKINSQHEASFQYHAKVEHIGVLGAAVSRHSDIIQIQTMLSNLLERNAPVTQGCASFLPILPEKISNLLDGVLAKHVGDIDDPVLLVDILLAIQRQIGDRGVKRFYMNIGCLRNNRYMRHYVESEARSFAVKMKSAGVINSRGEEFVPPGAHFQTVRIACNRLYDLCKERCAKGDPFEVLCSSQPHGLPLLTKIARLSTPGMLREVFKLFPDGDDAKVYEPPGPNEYTTLDMLVRDALLGTMVDQAEPDHAITASSHFDDAYSEEMWRCRPDNSSSVWRPLKNQDVNWVQVNFRQANRVCSILMSGIPVQEGGFGQEFAKPSKEKLDDASRVTKFSIQYKKDPDGKWIDYRDSEGRSEFGEDVEDEGGMDESRHWFTLFKPPIPVCHALRVNLIKSHNTMYCRFDLLGYPSGMQHWLSKTQLDGETKLPPPDIHSMLRALQLATLVGWNTTYVRKRLIETIQSVAEGKTPLAPVKPFSLNDCGELGGRFGDTLLHGAVRLRDDDLLQKLLECGADWKIPNSCGQTVVDLIGPHLGADAPHFFNSGVECMSKGSGVTVSSSRFNDEPATCVSLTYQEKPWTARDLSMDEFIQFDFPEPMRVVGVQSLGREKEEDMSRVTAYSILYREAGDVEWRTYTGTAARGAMLTGNFFDHSLHENRLQPIPQCIALRIRPMRWVENLTMRADVLVIPSSRFEKLSNEQVREVLVKHCGQPIPATPVLQNRSVWAVDKFTGAGIAQPEEDPLPTLDSCGKIS
jgi:hypothetical protein